MPKIFRNNLNKCIFNDKYEITDVSIGDTDLKLHKPISYNDLYSSIHLILDDTYNYQYKIFKMVIDDITVNCCIIIRDYTSSNYYGKNHNNKTIVLQIKINGLYNDPEEGNDYTLLDISLFSKRYNILTTTNYNTEFDKIIYVAYIINYISLLQRTSNQYVIVNNVLMLKDVYKSIINIINNNFDEDYNICWICRESCLDNETMGSCNHHIHTKCAFQIKKMRDTKHKSSEYKCGVCFVKINWLSINRSAEIYPNDNDSDSDNDE
jgi:hypothetical protein